jgi:hypothetical protein
MLEVLHDGRRVAVPLGNKPRKHGCLLCCWAEEERQDKLRESAELEFWIVRLEGEVTFSKWADGKPMGVALRVGGKKYKAGFMVLCTGNYLSPSNQRTSSPPLIHT